MSYAYNGAKLVLAPFAIAALAEGSALVAAVSMVSGVALDKLIDEQLKKLWNCS